MIYAFEDFELDTSVYELRRAGQRCPLEPRVFDVLVYLIQHHDRLVTKDELLERIWGDHFVAEATLAGSLMAARRAIGDTGREQRLIRTQHGRGYRFIGRVVERESATVYVAAEPAPGSDRATAVQPRGPAARIYGRDVELARLHDLRNRAGAGARQVVFITGDAGIGKSSLLDAFLAEVESTQQVRVGRGQCIEHRGSGEAYLPLLDALGRMCRGPDGPDLVRLLARHAPTWLLQMPWLADAAELDGLRNQTPAAPHERMLRELVEMLESLTTRQTLVLALEDLHWSDHSTVDLLAWLARRQDPARLLVIGTYRPADARARDHPLYAVHQDLRARGACVDLDLPLLSRDAVTTCLANRFPGNPFSVELARLLHQRTDGNPLFMRSLLDSWIGQGLVQQPDGSWTLRSAPADLDVDVPESLQELIGQQVARLLPGDQAILEAASVAGADFSAAAVAAALDLAEDDTEARCETLARSGRFLQPTGATEWPDGTITARFRFIHTLYQEVLYRRIPPGRQIRLHRRVGERLEAAYHPQAPRATAELALHFCRGRDPVRAVRYLKLAAEQALRRSAHREAIDQLLTAVNLLSDLPDTDDRARLETDVQMSLGWAYVAERGWATPEVERALTCAIELCRRLSDERQLSAALFMLAAVHEYRAQYGESQRLLEQQLSLRDGALVPESHEVLACSTFHQGRFGEALRVAERGLTMCTPDQPSALVVRYGEHLHVSLHDWAVLALWFLGHPDQALARAREAALLAHDHAYSRTTAQIHLAILHQLRGDADSAADWAASTLALAEEQGFAFRVAQARILYGWALAGQGHTPEGLAQLREGLAAYEGMGARVGLPYYLALLADALYAAGAADRALAALDDALGLIPAGRPFYYEAEIYRLRGRILLDAGLKHENREAERFLTRALDVAHRQGAKSLELRAALDIARLRRAQGCKDDARRLLAEVFRGFTEGFDTADLQQAQALLHKTAGT